MKTNILLGVLLLFVITNSYGQSAWATSDITLESNSFNKAHPYYEYFKTKDKDYIKWLYYGCASSQNSSKDVTANSTDRNKQSGLLIFKTVKKGILTYDTIRNCVHPSMYETEMDSGWESVIPIHGALPDGVWSNLDNNPKGNTEMTLYVQKRPVHAKLEVLTEKGDLIKTLLDANLEKGTYDFTWQPKSVNSGSYLLHTQIDGQLMIQRIQVRDSWLRDFFSGIYGSVKGRNAAQKYRNSEPAGKLPKGAILSINYNRHGVAVDLDVPKGAEVRIALLRPDGTLLKNIVDKEVKSTHYGSLLNNYVTASGTYLLIVEVDGQKRTQKVKLKKQV